MNQLEVIVDDKECMYVFDRGYLDYERFDRMTDDGYFFLTRLRKNAVIRVVRRLQLTRRFNRVIRSNGVDWHNPKSCRKLFPLT